jgi:hypothetical protein
MRPTINNSVWPKATTGQANRSLQSDFRLPTTTRSTMRLAHFVTKQRLGAWCMIAHQKINISVAISSPAVINIKYSSLTSAGQMK